MRNQVWPRAAALGGTLLFAMAARAQSTGAPSLGASDFTLTLADSGGNVLTNDQLASYFSRARCACPTSVTAGLTMSDTAAASLGTHTVDAQFMIGNDCDNAQATACAAPGGTVTLSATKTSTTASITTSAFFDAVAGGGCATSATTSSRFWAIVRLDGARLTTEPSLPLTLGGAGPSAPTDVKAVGGDQGLLVSWTASGDGATLKGHQVLCAPGPATASIASFDTCGVSAPSPDGGAGPFDSLEPQFVCSGLVAIGTTSTRVHGLENGRPYQIAVVAVGLDGTPSAPSAIVAGTPAPTVGFGDLYSESGGTASGCAVGGGGIAPPAVLAWILSGLLFAWRQRRGGRAPAAPARSAGSRLPEKTTVAHRACGAERLLILVLLAIGGAARPAAAADDILASPAPASPRLWNVELRFGPYRPNVDSEFANRGESARPYEQLFSSSRHLMTQLEIDRQLSHRAGTWAVGVGVGYFNVTAAALSQDLQSRTGDDTGLRLIPLSSVLVYRADTLRERWGSPLVPYAKAGLDCTLWQISDTSQADRNGRTLGWHAAAGVTLDLSPLDPEAAADMDRESGVNQTALFFEVARYSLDGFGSGSALHVGDTTWFAGLMLEL
jgi:hypothetical protein